ncbi:MAG: TRAP transporter small permease [Lachnospiraceae bacterium]|nr:TRAP transporter small permease [Lachnospiraceae bacterium]
MTLLKKIDEAVFKALKFIVVALCCGIAIILMLRVIMRFLPITFAMTWSDEIVEWMMAYMIFIASALIMREGTHFRVDLLQERFKGTLGVNVLNVFIAIINLVFFGVLMYYAIDLLLNAHQTTPLLRYPVQVAYTSIALGTGLIIIYAIRDLVNAVLLMVHGQKKAE